MTVRLGLTGLLLLGLSACAMPTAPRQLRPFSETATARDVQTAPPAEAAPAPEPAPAPAAPAAPARPVSTAVVSKAFAWQDFANRRHRVTLSFPQADLDAARQEFGCDPSLLKPVEYKASRTITYTRAQERDPAEMARLKAEADAQMQRELDAAVASHRQQLLSRGFTYIKENTVATDVATLWRWNRERLRGPTAQLRKVLKGKDFTVAALAFVQEIPYKEVPDTIDGRYLGGVLSPLEVLSAGWGDCDSKALLFASLVDDGTSGPEVILLRGPDHMLAAYACDPDAPGSHAIAFGRHWLVCECSHGVWPPGKVAGEVQRAMEDGKYTPIALREQPPA